MTSITYVTPAEMDRRTGFRHALGYTTSEGNILIRKGLPKRLERKVKRHEEDHVRKGEEGPFWGAVAAIGGSLISGILGSRASRRAAQAQERANAAAIAEQRRQFNTTLDLTQPGREVGNQSLNAIAQLLGLPGVEGMGEFDSSMLLDAPGTETIVNDAMRRIRQSGAARGSAGGNVLTELGDRISGFQNDRAFNSLFQLAGFGPQATNAAASSAGQTGANIGNLLQSSGIANASGIMGAGNSQNAALQNVLQFLSLQGMLGGGGSQGGRNFAMPGPGLTGINTNAIRNLRI